MDPAEILKNEVAATFGHLDDPDQIAKLCRDNQIQGFLGNCASCPMVKLIREKVNFPVMFTMGKKIGSGSWWVVLGERQFGFDASHVCDRFSDKFDCNLYPDLVAVPSLQRDQVILDFSI